MVAVDDDQIMTSGWIQQVLLYLTSEIALFFSPFCGLQLFHNIWL